MRRHLETTTLLSLFLLAGAAAAQPATSESATDSLAGIERSLEQVVSLLRAQVDAQRAGLALRRLDITSRELETRERELHQAQLERDTLDSQQANLELRRDTFGAEQPEDDGTSERDREYLERRLDVETEAIKQGLWRADQRILDLQQQIQRLREDLDSWEALITDALDGN